MKALHCSLFVALSLCACSSGKSESQPAPPPAADNPASPENPAAKSASHDPTSADSPAPTTAEAGDKSTDKGADKAADKGQAKSRPGAVKPAPPVALKGAEADAAKAYRLALAQGRKLANKGEHAQALPHFKEALKYRADDPALNSEVGWSAFKTGDLQLAMSATQASLKRAQRSNLQAASLYNLGRIQEKRGDVPAAREAYTRSLSLRPNATVQKRLAGLPGGGSAVPTSPASLPMRGPYASIAVLCEYLKKVSVEEHDNGTEDFHCELAYEDDEDVVRLAQLRAPFEAVKIMSYGASYDPYCELAVRIESGWYVSKDFLRCDDDGISSSVERLQALVGGGATVIETRMSTSITYRDSFFEGEEGDESYQELRYTWREYESYAMYCVSEGKGPPVCTPRMVVESGTAGQYTEDGREIESTVSDDLGLKTMSARLDNGTLIIVGLDDPFDEVSEVRLGSLKLSFRPAAK